MDTIRGIIKNVDKFKGLEPFVNGGTCLFRSRFLRDFYNHQIECGTALMYSNAVNKWLYCYDFHYWTIDEEENLYDSIPALNEPPFNDRVKFKKISTGKYLLIDALELGYDGSYKSGEKISDNIMKWATKYIPKNKYDVIYVKGLGSYRGEIYRTEEEMYSLIDDKEDRQEWSQNMENIYEKQKELFLV